MAKLYYGKRVTNEHAPEEMNGKRLVFEEVFRSAFPKLFLVWAEDVLKSIRECHDSDHGWVEIEAWIEKVDGVFYAVRHHAQYK